jgi:uncharacterized membrane protein
VPNDLSLAVEYPAYLWLLAVVPLLWVASRGSLRALGPVQRVLSLLFRSCVVGLIVLALADLQLVRSSKRLTVLYCLDQSLSIPEDQRSAMMSLVNASVAAYEPDEHETRAGVIVFGGDAQIEAPPLEIYGEFDRIASQVDGLHTDLSAALQTSRATFPADSSRRVVLVTDGNENLGDALAEARVLAEGGVSIDVVPIPLPATSDVSLDKLSVPASVRTGMPFELRSVLTVTGAGPDERVGGQLRIVRKAAGREQVVAEQSVELPPGKSVLTLTETLDTSGFFTYEARFTADDRRQDSQTLNNMSSAFAYLEGKGRVLLVENAEFPGRFDFLVEQLRQSELEVDVMPTSQLYTSLAELQQYDCVVLADVPRTAASGDSDVVMFRDDQVDMLVENTRSLGCGLVVLGGPHSYGAGGWAETKLEEALPVDLRIKDARVVPVGALALVIDKSGSMHGEKISLSKAAAKAAVKSLGARDFATVVAFDSAVVTVTPLQRAENTGRIAAQIDRLAASGGTDMFPALDQAVRSLEACQASVKHCIVLTDGQTPDGGFAALAERAVRNNITITVVAVGIDAQVPLLTKLASQAGGRFYAVRSARAVPRIFMNEARRVARPLVKDLDPKLTPVVASQHEILSGIEGLPPVGGLVLTTVKESPLVEVLLRSPVPVNDQNNALLATWTYGLGKVAALTTDAGARWTTDWTTWNGYTPFFSQMVRWTMRPSGDDGRFSIATRTAGDGTTSVVIDAIDSDDEFINLNTAMIGSVVGPAGKPVPLVINQVAPGRYIGSFESTEPGSYLVAVTAGDGTQVLRTGTSVSYTDEWRARDTNVPLLTSLAQLEPDGGPAGVLVGGQNPQPLSNDRTQLAALTNPENYNPFRRDLPPARSAESVWPFLVLLATCLFVGDVAVRRIQLDWQGLREKIAPLAARLLGRKPPVAAPATLDRLRARKADVQQQFATQRFESADEPTGEASPISQLSQPEQEPRPTRPAAKPAVEPEPGESYTERLMRAKRDATKRNDK